MSKKSNHSIFPFRLDRRSFLKTGLVGLLAAKTAPAFAATAARTSRSITVAWGVDARSLDPAFSDARVEQNVNIHIYDSLVTIGPQGQIIPCLAESWTNPQPNIWRFNLRKGVKFHNGEPFTAENVKFTIERLSDPNVKGTIAPFFRAFDRVEILNPTTVAIVLKAPTPLFLKFVGAYLYQLSPKYFAEKGIQQASISPVGTGAFRFVEWTRGDHITLEANRQYWKGAPRFDTLKFTTLPQPASRIAALRTGEVDVAIDVDPVAFKELQGLPGLKPVSVPGYRNIYLLVNHRAETPLKHRDVRFALNYAIDKAALVKNTLEGHGTPLRAQPYSPMYFGFNPDFREIPYDPDRARKLLADAGYPNGLDIDFVTPFGRYLKDKELTEVIAAQLEKVGIRCRIQVVEWANYMQKFMSHTNGPLAMTGQASPSLDCLEHFTVYWWSKGPVSHYQNPEFDKIVEAASTEMDGKRRLQLLQEGVKLLHDDAANIWLHQQHDIYGVRDRVLNWTPPNNQLLDFHEASVS